MTLVWLRRGLVGNAVGVLVSGAGMRMRSPSGARGPRLAGRELALRVTDAEWVGSAGGG